MIVCEKEYFFSESEEEVLPFSIYGNPKPVSPNATNNVKKLWHNTSSKLKSIFANKCCYDP
jgi:hypothetical protein